MMFRNLAAVAGAMAVASIVATTPAHAQTHDDRAIFAFSAPVSIPGATLPAGEYIFRLADADSGRKMVQVLDRDGHHYGIFFTQRVQRAVPAETAQVSLGEAPAGEVPSVSAWWQPGEVSGAPSCIVQAKQAGSASPAWRAPTIEPGRG